MEAPLGATSYQSVVLGTHRHDKLKMTVLLARHEFNSYLRQYEAGSYALGRTQPASEGTMSKAFR